MIHGIDTSFLVAVEVVSHPDHGRCHSKFRQLLGNGDTFGLAPQILAEFIHVVTDPRRFQSPLSVEAAVERAEFWWNASEVVAILPTVPGTAKFLELLKTRHLGRKRLLDTLLAAAFLDRGVVSLLMLNRADFEVFGCFQFPL